ncbi:MAG TPA: hypothetical protein VFZ61_04005 [Polyangiales bacterium]
MRASADQAELRVNQLADGVQQSASVALDATGGFAVAWQSEVDGSDEIRARRFHPSGTARGDELRVNTHTQGPQNLPAIASAPDGRFVVVWQRLIAGQFQIRARCFDAAGAARGGELAVSTARNETHGAARVAMDAKGNFVVVWESPIRGSYEIRARRYLASGAALGPELAVNTLSTSAQRSPAIAMNGAGQFVVVWRSNIAGSFDVRAQRFDANGAARGPELAVNAFVAGDQLAPGVALDERGNFVVVWENALDDRFEIRARRFSAGGVPVAEETAVSPDGGDQFAPAIAMGAGGTYVVAWHAQAADGSEIRARSFARNGSPRDTEHAINVVAHGIQKSVSVSMNARGDQAFAWHSAATGDWEVCARSFAQRAPRRVVATR